MFRKVIDAVKYQLEPDRGPPIDGDPVHRRFMTTAGHALPNVARKTLAASAYIGKGRIKDAVRVMRRKGNLPKLEERKGEDIDDHIARNAERADHHTNEYLGNPKGIQSAEHIAKADRHTAVYQRLKQYKKTGKIHESSKKESGTVNEALGRNSYRAKSLANRGGKSVLSPKKEPRTTITKVGDIKDKKPKWQKEVEDAIDKEDDPKYMRESLIKKVKRAFNKITGIQRRGLAYKTEKDYEDATNKADAYHDTYLHYKDRYGKSKKKFDKLSMDWYKDKRNKTDERIKDLGKRSGRIENAGRLEEAVSRRLIAKRSAEKQRTKYVVRKGEMPPIITPKSRFKFTDKEVNKLKGILDKQKSRRAEAKTLAMEIKKGVKTKANVPSAPEASRGTSVSVYSTPPSPGGHIHNAQPHVTDLVRAHQGKVPSKKKDAEGDLLRGFTTWTTEFAKTGDIKYLDSAKKAALTHYASMIAKISHHPGHPEYDTARSNAKSMLDAHLEAISNLKKTLPTPKPIAQKPQKTGGIFSRLKKMFKENSEV
jgi:hypothetical protein